MSGTGGYGYYYPPNAQNFQPESSQAWSEWSLEQQQYNNSLRNVHHNIPLNHTNGHSSSYVSQPPRSQNFYNNRHYQQGRYGGPSQSFPRNQQPNWQRNNNYKRSRTSEGSSENSEPKSKAPKKKKKPLSQNVPSKKDWTLEEADLALNVEKEFNKRCKNHSLIIKFPDLELNRDIVSKFHSSIENVHFQQPSTPRFCFVTLKESADAEMVIGVLNKIKFGDGSLIAEYKKDREEDQNIGPEDIDPCTLYVGNLAQEITKEDMVKTYPTSRRIDIGYAKKMKYTRYAFVSFKNVSDSIEAFKKTHSTQMYSKSLIVRFRRLHGTVGMPGESKPQSPPKTTSRSDATTETNTNDTANSSNHAQTSSEENCAVNEPIEVPEPDLSVVKKERGSDDDSGSEMEYVSPFMAGSIGLSLGYHVPMVLKHEIKEEDDVIIEPDKSDKQPKSGIKNEAQNVKNECEEEDDDDCGNLYDVNFGTLLDQIDDHSQRMSSLRKPDP